jgi:hypothetical protein
MESYFFIKFLLTAYSIQKYKRCGHKQIILPVVTVLLRRYASSSGYHSSTTQRPGALLSMTF